MTRTATFTRALQNMKTLAEGGTLPPPPPRGGGARRRTAGERPRQLRPTMRMRAAFAAAGVVTPHAVGLGAPLARPVRRDPSGHRRRRQGAAPADAALLALHRGQGCHGHAAAVGARGHDARAARSRSGVTREYAQGRRSHQGPVSSAPRQDQRLSARIPENHRRLGQGLGRRQRSPAQGFLATDWSTPCASGLSSSGCCCRCQALAAAQEWQEYTSLQDGFRLNFPGQPTGLDEHVDVAVELRAARARVQRRARPRTLLGHRRRLQQHRAARHRAREVVSARQRELPRQCTGDARRPATHTTMNAARSSTRRSSCCSATPS